MRHRLFLVLPFALLAGCSSLTSPPEREVEPTRAAPPAPTPTQPPAVVPVQAPPPKQEERAQASHILIAYKGARNAAPNVTRSKEQAKKRAENVLKKAQKGTDFGTLAGEYSEDPGSKSKGGDLGSFTRSAMVKPFSDAAFGLRAGELSGIVETEFGFHIIKRTQ